MRTFLLSCALACALTLSSENITLSLNNVPLKNAIETLNKDLKYSVVINTDEIDMQRKVTVDVADVPLEKALAIILSGQDAEFTVEGRSIVITKRAGAERGGRGSSAAPVKQSGRVVDENGEPVLGATVRLRGAALTVATNADGEFTLADAAPGTPVDVTFVGYRRASARVHANGKPLLISLFPDSRMLDEIVVVGYGSQRRANLTGAVSTISGKDINSRPVVSTANALQGADPSVNLTFGTGSPESGYSVNIRGVMSINGGSPLILCDGMELPLNQINPNDIASISVLKDASSCAIYGAKASAGVVLITTKEGANTGQKAKVTYNGRYGVTQNTTSTDFVRTGYDYVTFANEFYRAYNGVNMYLYEDEDLQKLLDRRNDLTESPERPWVEVGDDGKYYYYGNTDWYGYFYRRTRPQTEHNVSITGGNDAINYYISGRYYMQNGMFRVDEDTYKDYSFRAKFNARLRKGIKWSTNVALDNYHYEYGGTSNYDMTIARLESNISPSFVPRNPDGTIVQYTNQLYANSPLGAGDGGFMTSKRGHNDKDYLALSVVNKLDVDIYRDLTLTASYSYRLRQNSHRYRNNTFEYSRREGVVDTFQSGSILNSYQESKPHQVLHQLNAYLTYTHTWGGRHNFKATAGTQYDTYRQTSNSTKMTNLSNDGLSSFAAITPESVVTVSQSINTYKTLGFFGRVNYDFDGKYLFEASVRADGSSRFAEGDRWGVFPSASAGWRISQEPFFKRLLDVCNNLKLRASVGSLGNQQVSNYAYLQTISTDNVMNYTFDYTNKAHYASISAPVSSDLTWETVTTYDVGLDMAFLNNRLNVNADYYVRYTRDMLTTSLTLPDVYGASTPKQNCADMRTNGWEIQVDWNDSFYLLGRRFSYSITASLGDYTRTITKFHNPDRVIGSHYVGEKLGSIWGYHVEGLFKTDKEAADYQATINDKAVNQRVYNCKTDGYLRAGDVRFADLDGNNVIGAGAGTVDDPGDRRIIGNTTPRYNYSFRLGFNWYGFDVAAFFQGIGKRDWYPAYSASSQGSNSFWGPYSFPSTSFVHEDFASNCWTEDNRNAYFPRRRGYQSYSGGSLGTVNDRYLQSIAYLRFKNLTIGYTIPIRKNPFVERVRVYVAGENLYYWSPLKKYCKTIDPELAISSSTYSSNTGSGYAYPRTYTVGVDISF